MRLTSSLRRTLPVALLAAALLFPAGASATEQTIYPGVGIGKVKLGTTRAQLLRALGKDYIVNGRNGDATQLAWDYGSWTVTLVKNRVAEVAVTLRGQKTPAGIGPGSTWVRLRRAYPGGACTALPIPASSVELKHEYLVAHKGGTQTIYFGSAHEAFYNGKQNDREWRVTEVHVRTPYVRLPEFAASWPTKCRPDWRTADSP
jgi:hypothetical protein